MKKNIFILFLSVSITQAIHSFVLMFYLPTDAKGGRIINGEFEKDILSEWAAVLQDQLKEKKPEIQVVILGQTEKEYDHIKLISQANRINPDLIISLNAFSAQSRPQLFLYHVLFSTELSSWQKPTGLRFISYEQAYMTHAHQSNLFGKHIYGSLKIHTKEPYELRSFLGIPYKPLMGLLPPALGIELGSTNAKSWELTIASLVQAFIVTIDTLKGE